MHVSYHLLKAPKRAGHIACLLLLWGAGLVFTNDCMALGIEIKPENGLFHLHEETDVLLDAVYVGWAAGWRWDRPVVTPEQKGMNDREYTIVFPKQDAAGRVSLNVDGTCLNYIYLIEFDSAVSDTIGSGIEFNIDGASPRLQGKAKPYLLPDNRGWGWEIYPGGNLVASFSEPVASVYFERNNPYKIRAMFFGGELSPGTREIGLTICAPEKTHLAEMAHAYAQDESSKWLEWAMPPDDSFIDLSSLNEKPAGQHGFLRAEGDRFVFQDGQEGRFWGVNIQANSLFIRDKEVIRRHARRLARLGVNLVRLHHHDSATWVRNSLIKDGGTTQELDEQALDSYFWWVKCLRDEGIYIWLDLQGMRPWREGDDIPGWGTDMADDTKRGMSIAKGFVYLNERMQLLTREFNEKLLTRVNPYTERALKDDPAIMGLLITNENDLTHHFGNVFLADKGHPYHQGLFEAEVEKFSLEHDLPAAKVGRTWEAGPSKLLLNELEARFNRDMIDHLRNLGVKVPIATTNLWGGSPIFSLPALTTGDMIDVHAYADADSLFKNPHYSANFVHWLGQGQVADMPMTISEYNVGNRELAGLEGFIVLPYIAAMAAFQGWDAMMLYGYSQDGFRGKTLSPWSSYMNPAIAGLMPAAAVMYRKRHVLPAAETFVVAPDIESFYYHSASPRNSAILRTAPEQHRMVVAIPETEELPWLEPVQIGEAVNHSGDLNADVLPGRQDSIHSDTGELSRDWKKGILVIDAPNSQGAVGMIGGERIMLEDVGLDIATPRATVLLTSLDGEALRHSGEILISTAARVREAKEGNWYSVESEIVSGRIELTSEVSDLTIRPLLPDGKKGDPVSVRRTGHETFVIDLPDNARTHWFLLEKTEPSQ